jgi:hypothetical protein
MSLNVPFPSRWDGEWERSGAKDSRFHNQQLYGTFAATKERIVQVGRGCLSSMGLLWAHHILLQTFNFLQSVCRDLLIGFTIITAL